MKMPLLFVMFSVVTLSAFSQDIDRHKFTVSYVKLPSKKLPQDVETYKASISSIETSWGNTIGSEYDIDGIALHGYHKIVDEDVPDLRIEITPVRELEFDKVKAGVDEQTYKASKNSPTITYFAHYYTVFYISPQIQVKLVTRNGTIVEEFKMGGAETKTTFGNFDYTNHYRSESVLSNAWASAKLNFLAASEKTTYKSAVGAVPGYLLSYCLNKVLSEPFSIRYVDERKKNDYADLREAKTLFLEGVAFVNKDHIASINKLLQPEYEKRKEIIKKAIAIWEKTLAEADYENKKARIDQKVAKHITYNLALAYFWIDDFGKAKEYLQARKEDVSKKWALDNTIAGIKELANLIDQHENLFKLNEWRKLMYTDPQPYVYKKKETPSIVSSDSKAKGNNKFVPGKSGTAKKTTTSLNTQATPGSKTSVASANTSLTPPAELNTSEVIINNINYNQLQTVANYLKKQPKIKSINKKIQNTQGLLEIQHSWETDKIADHFSKCNCGVKMEIVSVDDSKIEIEVKK